MAHVSSFPLPPFALPSWRRWRRAASPAATVPAASHPVSAVRLGGFVGSLWRVCDSFSASAPPGQQLRFSCVVTGEPPSPLLETLIRLTTFLVSDAASACADDAVAGRIGILVERQPTRWC